MRANRARSPRPSSSRCSSRAQGFAIEVRDRGPGFTPAALENALVPFYSTKETGTGLGLTLCREIVEAHGGRLRIANREGGGARRDAVAAGW